MFDAILMEVKAADFVISEIVTDKDTSSKSVFLEHFPEGTVTYCSNHCSKTLYRDLQAIKQNNCQVCNMGVGR